MKNKTKNTNLNKDGLGFMGLSVGKKLFEKKSVMEKYARFLSENFSESFFLIADIPKKYNLVAIDGITEEEAVKKVQTNGQNMKRFLEKITEKCPNLKVLNYKDLQSETYYSNLEILKKAYEENLEFKEECRNGVKEFLNIPSNKKKIKGKDFSRILEIAVNYRIDELAILLSISYEFENICEIYPGRDILQEKLHEGKFEFFSELKMGKNRTFREVYYEN